MVLHDTDPTQVTINHERESGKNPFWDEVEATCKRAKLAAATLAAGCALQRTAALLAIADELEKERETILAANARDLTAAVERGLSAPLLSRLRIDESTFATMVRRVRSVAVLPDPIDRVLVELTNPEGMLARKVTTPLGVLAMIYESRPNVTTDCAAACLRSGNSVVLRGGSEALQTNIAVTDCVRRSLAKTDIPPDAVQLLAQPGHEAVDCLLRMNRYVDMLIPRGGRSLIKKVEENSRIPLMRHYDGICHQYLAADAAEAMAVEVVVNSKCQRLEVCNALETLLVDAASATRLLPPVCAALQARGVELRGCEHARAIIPALLPATEEDWRTEYLNAILSIRIVDGIAAATEHIRTYGSGHTDGIVTASEDKASEFVRLVDSSSVLINASTRLSGGEAYGMGAVVGISTGKLHARGPVGPAELTSHKWVAWGKGHLRT